MSRKLKCSTSDDSLCTGLSNKYKLGHNISWNQQNWRMSLVIIPVFVLLLKILVSFCSVDIGQDGSQHLRDTQELSFQHRLDVRIVIL